MNHVHDSMEETPLEVAWQNFLREAGLATAVTASKYFDEALKARLAAELPNIAKAVLNTPIDKLGDPIECETFAAALAPLAKPRVEFVRDNPTPSAGGPPVTGVTMDELSQPVAAGDVSEWCRQAAASADECGSLKQSAAIIHAAAESELSRRVAEAVADRDRWIERTGDHAAAMKEIAIERDAIRQQLAAAQAEVERLKEANAEHLKQRLVLDAEVSRLSRPVDGVWDKMVDLAREIPAVAVGDIAIGCTASLMYRTVEPLLQSERNARESAERERDELREACNKYVAISNTSDENKKHTMYAASERHGAWGNRCVDYIYATPADAMLAAFRAEKAKVAT